MNLNKFLTWKIKQMINRMTVKLPEANGSGNKMCSENCSWCGLICSCNFDCLFEFFYNSLFSAKSRQSPTVLTFNGCDPLNVNAVGFSRKWRMTVLCCRNIQRDMASDKLPGLLEAAKCSSAKAELKCQFNIFAGRKGDKVALWNLKSNLMWNFQIWELFTSGGGGKVALVPVWGKVALFGTHFGTHSVLGASQ